MATKVGKSLAATLLLLLSACGIPNDVAGTLDRVRHGTLRAGISENPPRTSFDRGRPGGREVEIVETVARELDADVVWTRGAESKLLAALERGELDIVVGGLLDSTPWEQRVGLTRPYDESQGRRHVLAVRRGENRWLLELDRTLSRSGASP